jgi:hypothetical protein
MTKFSMFTTRVPSDMRMTVRAVVMDYMEGIGVWQERERIQ